MPSAACRRNRLNSCAGCLSNRRVRAKWQQRSCCRLEVVVAKPVQLIPKHRQPFIVAVGLHYERTGIPKRTKRLEKTIKFGSAGTQHDRAAAQHAILDMDVRYSRAVTGHFFRRVKSERG